MSVTVYVVRVFTGEPGAARWSAIVANSLALALGLVVLVALVVARHSLGHMFSHDPQVLRETATLAPLLGGTCSSSYATCRMLLADC